MANLVRRSTQVLVFSGILSVSGILFGAAAASDPAHVKQLIDTRSCANCDLSEANLAGFTLAKTDLSGANLRQANLYKATLTGANLTGADLTGANLSGAQLAGATGAVLTDAITDAKTTCPDKSVGPCR